MSSRNRLCCILVMCCISSHLSSRNVIVSNRNGCHVPQVGRIDCSMELMSVMQVYYEIENDDNCGWSIIVAISRGDF